MLSYTELLLQQAIPYILNSKFGGFLRNTFIILSSTKINNWSDFSLYRVVNLWYQFSRSHINIQLHIVLFIISLKKKISTKQNSKSFCFCYCVFSTIFARYKHNLNDCKQFQCNKIITARIIKSTLYPRLPLRTAPAERYSNINERLSTTKNHTSSTCLVLTNIWYYLNTRNLPKKLGISYSQATDYLTANTFTASNNEVADKQCKKLYSWLFNICTE